MKLYEQHGFSRDLVDPGGDIRSVERWLGSEDRVDIAIERRSCPVTTGHLVAVKYYLLDDHANARLWARKVVDFADEYFFGAWRDRVPSGTYQDKPPDRAFYDKRAGWLPELQAGLLWGSCLGEWDRVGRYAAYLRDDVIRDAEQSVENRAWYLILAGGLRGRPWAEMTEFVETVRRGRRKQEQLLLDVLESIYVGDDSRKVDDASTFYFRHHKRTRAKSPSIPERLAIDYSIVSLLAKQIEKSPQLPENSEKYIVFFH